ncbi:PilZ domain-containing protein [Sphingobium amiense]|uniref:PilZ domain-containing protein n=1 Tax=Sphingobium amiense TaxID=135719 RepID=A0A494WDT8_9SPHN|nr:PilZ domain-containing protein [Sphingobium amiense]BBD98569.1 PilZ domain-containing protein [Sphingobium amiense]
MNAPYHTVLHRFHRSSERLDVSRASTLRLDDGDPLDVLLEDVAVGGCRISGVRDLAPQEAIMIGLAGVGSRPARVVWSQGGQAGCEFDQALTFRELEETQAAGNVVTGNFATFRVQAEAALFAEQPKLSRRARLAVLAVAVIASWGIAIGLASLAMSLFA